MVLEDTAAKISSMEIRGAGKIARSAVFALKEYGLGLQTGEYEEFKERMEKAATLLLSTRPTAVSLPNAVGRVMRSMEGMENVGEAQHALAAAADEFIEDSVTAVSRIAEIGARHIPDGAVVMTHCNSEAALACILKAHADGREVRAIATEVRPRNQGLLTIRTLNDAGIPTEYIVDSAARSVMNRADLVITGADAVTVNGAVVNKIGTSQIALSAHEARTPFIVAAETYKFAPRTVFGELVEIEERSSDEVLDPVIAAEMPYVTVRNPAFDVTPPAYIDQIITEIGALPPGLVYAVIRESLGWGIGDLQKTFQIDHRDQE